MDVKDQKIRELEKQVKDLTMRLSAIKAITTKNRADMQPTASGAAGGM